MRPLARRAPWAALLLAACASGPFEPSAVVPGDSKEDVLRKMGPPTATYVMSDGRPRFEYTRMPAGRKTYMIDFDDAGRVTRWEQVLDEAHFLAIVPGMRGADVRRLIGPPSDRGEYRFPERGVTWSYRYESVPKCQLFQVALDARTETVVSTFYPPDPQCPGEMRLL
jgi:hypothetical protein